MKGLKKYIKKYALSLKQNLLILLLLIFLSFIQSIFPITQYDNFYVYKYGLIYPWIECYSRSDLGPVNIFTTMFSDSYLGTSWYLQNIIFAVVFINMFIILVRYIKNRSKYFCS